MLIDSDEAAEQQAQKSSEPPQQQWSCCTVGREVSVGAIAAAAFEVMPAHSVLRISVPDHRLDRARRFISRS